MKLHQNKLLLTQALIPPSYVVLLTEEGSVEPVSSLQPAGNSSVEEDEEEVNPRYQSTDHVTIFKIITTEQFYFYKGFSFFVFRH